MSNLIPNLKTFLVEMQSYVETITEKDGKIILRLKPEIGTDPDKYLSFMRFFNPLQAKLQLQYYVEQKYQTKSFRPPGRQYDLDVIEAIEFHIDTLALHAERLKDYFQKDITKADVTESIGFLVKNGWTEKEFQAKIRVSKSTFFRYLPKPQTCSN